MEVVMYKSIFMIFALLFCRTLCVDCAELFSFDNLVKKQISPVSQFSKFVGSYNDNIDNLKSAIINKTQDSSCEFKDVASKFMQCYDNCFDGKAVKSGCNIQKYSTAFNIIAENIGILYKNASDEYTKDVICSKQAFKDKIFEINKKIEYMNCSIAWLESVPASFREKWPVSERVNMTDYCTGDGLDDVRQKKKHLEEQLRRWMDLEKIMM